MCVRGIDGLVYKHPRETKHDLFGGLSSWWELKRLRDHRRSQVHKRHVLPSHTSTSITYTHTQTLTQRDRWIGKFYYRSRRSNMTHGTKSESFVHSMCGNWVVTLDVHEFFIESAHCGLCMREIARSSKSIFYQYITLCVYMIFLARWMHLDLFLRYTRMGHFWDVSISSSSFNPQD